jgi:hypothetical protein
LPFVNIPATYTADPGNVWTPKSSFVSSDPFMIVTRVQVSADVVQAGLRYDAYFTAENPRQDFFGRSWWVYYGGEVKQATTRDAYVDNFAFQFTDFAVHVSWGSYQSFIQPIKGPEALDGVFLVRGTINVRGSNLFAHSGNFAYKVAQ